MKNRTGFALAALAAAALLISACGSDPTPTPTAAPLSTAAAGGSADAPTAEQAPTGDSAAPQTDQSMDTATPATDDTATDDTTTDDTTTDDTTSSVPPLEFDATTTTFFSTMCTGLADVLTADFPEYDANQPAEGQRQAAVEMFSTVGEAMSSTAGQLQQIPPPTFDRGDEVAAVVISAFSKAGTAATQGAADIAAAPDADLEKTIEDAENLFDEAGDELDGANDVMEQPGMEEALRQIPACEPMFGM